MTNRWVRNALSVAAAALALLAVPIASAAQAQTSVETDRATLVALYHATDGSNWRNNSNWLSDRPLGEWHGVITDGNGRVTGLNLRGNRLSGPIPAELGSLFNLESLGLEFNQLSGPIPVELGSLANLQYVNLSNNQLSGSIPAELGSLANLQWLHLYDNSTLSGPLPGSLTGLTSLTGLSLDGTDLCAPTENEFQTWLQGA